MYTTIAGLVPDPDHPGHGRFSVRPQPGGGLTRAAESPRTPHGMLATSWHDHGGAREVTVTAPPGTSATISVPAPAAGRPGSSPARAATRSTRPPRGTTPSTSA